MKKSGITIINSVIALVLLAIFAFVVFHKLFAVDTRVRAIEVNSQAGKWNKLLLAYAIANERLGSFKEIGFTPYGKVASDGESSRSKTFDYSSDKVNGEGRFLAINIIKLDHCRKYEGEWLAYGNPEQFVGNAVAELPVAKCAVLTPEFELFREF